MFIQQLLTQLKYKAMIEQAFNPFESIDSSKSGGGLIFLLVVITIIALIYFLLEKNGIEKIKDFLKKISSNVV